MITVREINDPAELPDLRQTWDELHARTPEASFLHSWAWFAIYWKHFGAGKGLRVLVVEDGGRAIGIVPLLVRIAKWSEPVRILTYPLDENEWVNYSLSIGPDSLTVLTAALEHIRLTPRDWHILELSRVDVETDQGRTKTALENAGLSAICEVQFPRAVINLAETGTWEDYLATRGSKRRTELRSKEKRLARRGKVSFVRYRPLPADNGQADYRWDLYDACEAVAEASWQGNSQGNMLNKDKFREFYRDCHRAAVEQGAADLCVLYVDNQPVGFQYAYQSRGMVVGVKTAYDRAFAAEGAGNVLVARTVADSFERGDKVFGMGSSRQEYKRLWQTQTLARVNYVHFPPGALVAQVIRAKRAVERRLKSTVRQWQTAARVQDSRARGPSTKKVHR
jgi:CelD/BcsL family acetyltransferase involved in cellulose biosynthesis